MDELSQLQQALQAVLSREAGEPVTVRQLQQLTAGAAAQTWSFQANDPTGERSLILRRGHAGEQFGGALDKTQEAAVLKAAGAAGVPVPAVVAVLQPADGLGEGFIMPRISGETLPPKILRSPELARAREHMAVQCGEILSTIHAVPLDQVAGLPEMSAQAQLDFYQKTFHRFDEALPMFELTFRWLRDHLPDASHSTLVHGDFRNGNLIVDEAGIKAVLDWELAHIGDPMEDLGWLCVNSWRFGHSDQPVGGFGQREDLYRAYAETSGETVEHEAVRFWELFGILKWGVICLYQTHVHLSGKEQSVERAAIGRRVSECELDMLELLRGLNECR